MERLLDKLRDRKFTGCLLGILCLCVLIWLVIVPLIMIGINSFQTDEGIWTSVNWSKVGTKENLTAIKNSLILGLSVTGVSTLLALPCAYLLAKTPLRRFWWIDLILMIVFMVPPYINSNGWLYLMGESGLLTQFFPSMKEFAKSFISFPGLMMVMSFHSYPFLLTIMKNAILSVPKEIDDSLGIYGKSKVRNFFKVYAPLLLPNFLIGAFLVFVKVLAEYGSPEMFSYFIDFPVFTTLLTDYVSVYPIDMGQASSMAFILIFICMFIWMMQSFVSSRKKFSLKQTKKSGVNRNYAVLVIGVLFLFALFFVSTILPIGTIVLYSFVKSLAKGVTQGNFSFRNYERAFSSNSGFGSGLEAFGNTLYISLLGSIFLTVMGLVFGIYYYRHRKDLKVVSGSVENISIIPEMLPNIVMALGFIMLYNTIRSPIYRTPFMLILAYSIIFLPNAVSYVKSSLLATSRSLTDAGDVFSKSRLKVDIVILVPLTLRNVFYGFAMSFIITMRELVVAKILQPPSYYVMSTYIDFQFNQGNTLVGMAMSVISLLMTFILLLPLEALFMREKKPRRHFFRKG